MWNSKKPSEWKRNLCNTILCNKLYSCTCKEGSLKHLGFQEIVDGGDNLALLSCKRVCACS